MLCNIFMMSYHSRNFLLRVGRSVLYDSSFLFGTFCTVVVITLRIEEDEAWNICKLIIVLFIILLMVQNFIAKLTISGKFSNSLTSIF